MSNRSVLILVISAALSVSACSTGPAVECGEGTIKQGNKCVVATAAEPATPAKSPTPPAPLPSTTTAPTIDASTAPPTRWRYQSDKDSMRDVTSDFAANVSKNSVDIGAPYGHVELQILLRKGPKFGNDVIVSLSEGQVSCNILDGCTIAARFDQGKIETFRASGSDSPLHPALFVRNVNGFVARLRTAKSVVLEVPTFTAGARQFEFDVAGLDWDPYAGKVLRE